MARYEDTAAIKLERELLSGEVLDATALRW
jgi:hypothetical protein